MNSHLNLPALSITLGLVLPLITGFITKAKAPSWVKSVVNALLSAITGAAIVAVHNSGNVDVAEVVIGIAETWGASIVSHAGVWAPTGVAKKVQNIAAEFGFGKAQLTEVEQLVEKFLPSAKPVITEVTAEAAADTAGENDPTRINTQPADAAAALSVALSADTAPAASAVDKAAAAVVADVAPLVADPSPAAVETVAAEVAAPVAEAALSAVEAPAPVADVVQAVATDAPAVVAEAKVDPKAAAIQGVKDALDELLKAVA